MKNVQIIDGAENCTFSLFQATDAEFALIFPAPGQDIEFIEDLCGRIDEAVLTPLLSAIWERPIKKPDANGIHGTLFFEFADKRKHFPSTKCEKDWNPQSINAAQRRLYER